MPLESSTGEPGRARKARDYWAHLSRAAKWVVVTVLAAGIGAPVGAIATQVVMGDGERSDTSTAPNAPSAALERLLTHIPSDFRSTCRSVTRPPRDAPASANCYPSFGASFVQYRQYRDAATLASQLDSEIEVKLGSAPEAEGDCSDGRGIEDWEFGLALCYVDGGVASIDWIDVRLVIYAWAQRSDGDHQALLEDWRQGVLGPNP